jgi:hypothetical protein
VTAGLGWLKDDSFRKITAGFALAGVIFSVLKQRLRGRNSAQTLSLEMVIANLISAGAVPVGILILLCAFNERFLGLLHDSYLYFLAAGVAVLFVALKDLLR